MRLARLLLALPLCAPLACAPATPAQKADAPVAVAAAPAPSGGIDLAGMDTAVAPGDDFFRYANGGWYARTEIPADRSASGNFANLDELTSKRTADLIAEIAKTEAPAGTDERRIADTYASFLDEAGIEAKGLAPLQPRLAAIAAISDKVSLSRVLGGGVRADVDVLNSTKLFTRAALGLWVAQDLDEPGRYAAFLLQGGLGLPDRDYYLSDSPRMAGLRAKYQAHVAALLTLAGVGGQQDAAAKAARVVALETRLAKGHSTRTETSDVKRGNLHWTRAELEKHAPGLDWAAFLGAAGLDKQPVFVAWHPGALAGLASAVHDVPVETWKEYLTFHALAGAATWLPKAFVEESFDFNGRALTGTLQLRPRWKRGISVLDAALGEAVGRLYVTRYFPAAEKARAAQMVKNIIAAFGRRVDALTWMSPQTKAEAKAKLAVLEVGVGVSRQVARLFGPRGHSRRRARQPGALVEVRLPAGARAAARARRPQGVGDEPAAGQRGQPAGDERAQLPGGDAAAALFRPESTGIV